MEDRGVQLSGQSPESVSATRSLEVGAAGATRGASLGGQNQQACTVDVERATSEQTAKTRERGIVLASEAEGVRTR